MWKKTLDKYEASDDGRIRNAKTGREIKQFLGPDGYLRTQIAGKTRLVHRVIAKTYIPEVDGKAFINHIDGNKQNNTVSNLEWVTRSENLKHAYAIGLKDISGTKNPRCKLTAEQIRFIKENYIAGDIDYGAKALGRRFGVAHQTICAVVSGQNWEDFES